MTSHALISCRLGQALLLASFAAGSQAHVILPSGGATAGTTYRANFIVGHACQGAAATTALRVKLPAGFTFLSAEPRAGWTLSTQGKEVTWTATSPATALPGKAPASFTLVGKLPDAPGTLWFPTLQTCDVGSTDWSVESAGTDKPSPTPAPHLDVLAPGIAPIDVRDARAKPTVGSQRITSVFMRLSAPSGGRLVSASSSLGQAAIHQMEMTGDVMRMRELPQGIELPPGQAVELTPGGLHIMVTGLSQALPDGGKLPLTLQFVDRDGRQGKLEVEVPVSAAPSAAADEHHHMH